MAGGPTQTDGDKYVDYFEPYVSPKNGKLLDGCKSNNGIYNYNFIAPICFVVNTTILNELGVTVDSGEYVVGLTYEDGADTLLKSGSDRIRIQHPENGASGATMGCAMIENCLHPEAAKAMINLLMRPEGQEALAIRLETLRFTNPKARYEIKYLPADDTINWVSRDTSRLIEHKAEMLEKWNALYAETR